MGPSQPTRTLHRHRIRPTRIQANRCSLVAPALSPRPSPARVLPRPLPHELPQQCAKFFCLSSDGSQRPPGCGRPLREANRRPQSLCSPDRSTRKLLFTVPRPAVLRTRPLCRCLVKTDPIVPTIHPWHPAFAVTTMDVASAWIDSRDRAHAVASHATLGISPSIASRSDPRIRFCMREICICVTPNSSAISCCVLSQKNRR